MNLAPIKFLKRFIYAGVHRLDAHEARSVIIVNIMTIIPASLAFIFGPILFFATGQWQLLFCPVIEGLILMSVPFFNKMEKYTVAKFIMFSTHCVSTVFFSIVLGPAANVELITVFLIGLSFLIFHTNLQRGIAMLVMVLLVTIPGILHGYEFIRFLILVSVIALNVLVLYFYSTHFSKSIATLLDYSKSLEQKTEKLENVNRSKSLAFNHTNHETRNYLNVVASISEELLLRIKENPGKESISLPVSQAQALGIVSKKMMLLVNNVLDFSVHENERFKIEKSLFLLQPWINDIIHSFQVIANEKAINICLDAAQDLPKEIFADQRELATILCNLISNAIKFARENTIIQVYAALIEQHLIFKVQDEGPGISEQQLGQIFKPYITHKNGYYRGTGLGLPLVKKTIESMGGSIAVDSQLKKGSTFTICLPLEKITPASELPKPKTLIKTFNKTILVIDDDPLNLKIIEMLLSRMGCHSMLEVNLHNGIQTVQRSKPDLILLDMNLNIPGINGRDALQMIKAHADQTPIISVTGETGKNTRDEMFAAGVAGFVTKPILWNVFYDTLQTVFEKQ